jgi:hypothetical protein
MAMLHICNSKLLQYLCLINKGEGLISSVYFSNFSKQKDYLIKWINIGNWARSMNYWLSIDIMWQVDMS